MTRRPRSLALRDQEPSTFGFALMRLCDATGALGAALVDGEGESVDYAATMTPFDMKIAAAEMSLLLGLLRASRIPGWQKTEELVVRASRRTLSVHVLDDGYAIVLLLPTRAFNVSHRAVCEAARDIEREAGMAGSPRAARAGESWSRVEVRSTLGDVRRPEAVWLSGAWRTLVVLGRVVEGLVGREVGFRARLATGAELTLVREPLGRWYVDGFPADLVQ